jgi:hypothetical protein
MQKTLQLIAILLVCIPLNAQLKTYLTLEAGPHWSLIKVDDPGDYFKSATVGSTIAGVTIEQELMENLSVAAGLCLQPYKTGLNMIDDRSQQQRLDSHFALMIPLRIQYRIQPTEFPVSVTPKAGYVYSLNADPAGEFDHTGVLSAPDGTAFSYDQQQTPGMPDKHLIEVGLGIDLRFSGLWQASLNLSYLTGVLNHPSTSFNLNYSDRQGNDHAAVYSTKGNGIYSSLSFHIPVSNLWQNRDYRIRERIENSVYEGKPVERKGQYYAGAEAGSLWRLFYSYSPAVSARPMEERGFLRYANFHGGVYVGYMIAEELGVDLGVNYQRSSTFYSLSYDHEVDYAGELKAPMYLEVPLRIRYFYNLYQEKIYVVVYGGASVLVQFSSGEYAAPGGDFTYRSPDTQSDVSATSSSTAERLSYIIPVLRLGAGLEYRLPVKFPLFITGYFSYMQGFMAAEQADIVIAAAENPGLGNLVYNGSGWVVDLGVKIPLTFRDHDNCVKLPVKREKKESGERR